MWFTGRAGDEFVALLRGQYYNQREALPDLFRRESEAHIAAKDVVVSVGCTDYRPGEDRNLQAIFQRADALMYEHKKQLKSMGAAARL